MANGHPENEDHDHDGRTDFTSVTQTTENGTQVTVTRGYNDRGQTDYYFVNVQLASGSRYYREISPRDVQAWREVSAGRQAMRDAFEAAPGFGWFSDFGVEFTRREAGVLAQYIIQTGTHESQGVEQPPEVLGDPEAPRRAGPIGGQAQEPEGRTPPRR